MLAVTKPGQVLRQAVHPPAEYSGWHAVGLRRGPLKQVAQARASRPCWSRRRT
jgi:hypothetical protein